jgi:hypothetical protein
LENDNHLENELLRVVLELTIFVLFTQALLFANRILLQVDVVVFGRVAGPSSFFMFYGCYVRDVFCHNQLPSVNNIIWALIDAAP